MKWIALRQFSIAAIFSLGSTSVMAQQVSINVLAAGSLREALNEIRSNYEKASNAKVTTSYGPSGKLRSQIESGRPMDVFASASMEHTDKLLNMKMLDESRAFASNDLCVVSRAGLNLTEENLLSVLSDAKVRLATSTPVSDPMGDYTWQFFRKADSVKPGTYQALDAKALKLSGAAAPMPGEKLPYVTAFEDNKADVYVMYCTNAVSTKASVPSVGIFRIPDSLNVRSAYGIGANPTSDEGKKFVRYVAGPEGQAVFRKYGFN